MRTACCSHAVRGRGWGGGGDESGGCATLDGRVSVSQTPSRGTTLLPRSTKEDQTLLPKGSLHMTFSVSVLLHVLRKVADSPISGHGWYIYYSNV